MNTQFNSNVIWLQLEYKISTLKEYLDPRSSLLYRCSSCTNFALSKYSNIYNILSTVRRYQSVLFSNITWVWIILRNVQVPCSLLGRPGSRFKRVEIYAIRCRSTVQNLKSLLLFTWNWIIDPARIMYCGYCNCRFSSCVVQVPRFWTHFLKIIF